MKKAYVLMVSHGDYEDYVEFPVAVVLDFISAVMIRDAIAKREEPYIKNIDILNEWRRLGIEDYSVDIQEVPLVEV